MSAARAFWVGSLIKLQGGKLPDPRVRYLRCGHGHHRWMGSSCPLPCCLGCGLTCAVVAFAKQHERSDSLDHTVLLLQQVWGREALEACAWNSTGGSLPPCVLDPAGEVVYSDALFPSQAFLSLYPRHHQVPPREQSSTTIVAKSHLHRVPGSVARVKLMGKTPGPALRWSPRKVNLPVTSAFKNQFLASLSFSPHRGNGDPADVRCLINRLNWSWTHSVTQTDLKPATLQSSNFIIFKDPDSLRWILCPISVWTSPCLLFIPILKDAGRLLDARHVPSAPKHLFIPSGNFQCVSCFSRLLLIFLIFKIESCCVIHSDLELTLTQAGSDSPSCHSLPSARITSEWRIGLDSIRTQDIPHPKYYNRGRGHSEDVFAYLELMLECLLIFF